MTEEQELRLFLYVYCKGNIVEAKMAYNFIMGDNVPKGSDFDVDKFRQTLKSIHIDKFGRDLKNKEK